MINEAKGVNFYSRLSGSLAKQVIIFSVAASRSLATGKRSNKDKQKQKTHKKAAKKRPE
jgi:hypothetical protein